tara:strand:- start:16387 stop:16839 length:453 start_codon:yes stop_codon:yes gene_type:complete
MTEALPERALSIRQPWVWAILNAGKRIENRPRRFNYRGPICLHASMTMGRDEISSYRWCAGDVAAWHTHKPVSTRQAREKPPSVDDLCPIYDDLPRGGIIGTAEIVDCIEQSDDPWFFGPFGLVLKNVQPVPFIPVKGALGLFRWQPLIT